MHRAAFNKLNMATWCFGRAAAVFVISAILFTNRLGAQQVEVRHKEGLVHGFLVLQTLEGQNLADGELIQNSPGDEVTSRLVFHFKDGSLHDETAVFSQRGKFRLLSYHLVQKGPAFEHPLDVTIKSTGVVTVRYSEDGKEKSIVEHLDLPPDTANGIELTLLKNIRPETPETKLAFVVAAPKPQLVKLRITPKGEEPIKIGEAGRSVMHYVVKVDIGGIKGVFASLAGKEPPDTQVWILQGEAPAFLKSEGPLAPGGPVWRIKLASPNCSCSATEPK